jgi:hypothetical protein
VSGTTQITIGANDQADHAGDLIVTFIDTPAAPGTDITATDGTRTALPGDRIGTYLIAPSASAQPGCVVTMPSTGPVTTAPPQAVAVGMTLLTYGPAVTLNTNWWPWTGNIATQNITQNADGSVTDHGGAGNQYNAHVVSTNTNGTGFTTGVIFGGGGYFEITMKFSGLPGGYGRPETADGWPAWWYSDPGTNNAPMHVEVDILEWFVNASDAGLPANAIGGTAQAFSSAPIDWYGPGQQTPMFGSDAGLDSTSRVPANNDPSQYHKVGGLWVPATSTTQGYLKTFFDDVQVGPMPTWTLYNGGTVPVGAGGTAPNWSSLDVSKVVLLWGTGTNNPMTVSSIKVWQRSDGANIRRNVPLPAA